MMNPSVMLSFPHPGSVRTEFMMSVLAAMGGDSPVAQIDAYGTGPALSKARNEMARRFLATSCEWLWMADADMEFTARTLPALLSAADPASAPVIGALCFAKDPGGGVFPVAYKSVIDEGGNLLFGRAKLVWHPDGKPVRVAATGTGCLLMHRSVFARIDDAPIDLILGRDDEIREAKHLLLKGSPAIALLGPGEWGKQLSLKQSVAIPM